MYPDRPSTKSVSLRLEMRKINAPAKIRRDTARGLLARDKEKPKLVLVGNGLNTRTVYVPWSPFNQVRIPRVIEKGEINASVNNPLTFQCWGYTFVQSTRTQRILKPSKPCHVGIQWKAPAEYSQLSTHVPVLQSFFRVFCIIFVLAKLATSSIRVKISIRSIKKYNCQ